MFYPLNPEQDRDRYANAEITRVSARNSMGQVEREHTPLVPVACTMKACGALAAAGHCEGRDGMNGFWVGGGRGLHGTLAGGFSPDSAGRPARRKASGRVLCGWLSVVIAGAAAGCTGSPGSTGPGRAATAASPSPVFFSRTLPDAQVGRQLAWFLRAVANLPWSPQEIKAHFDSRFLAQISPGQLNSILKQTPRRHPVPSSRAPSG